jgi:hypothetical protein
VSNVLHKKEQQLQRHFNAWLAKSQRRLGIEFLLWEKVPDNFTKFYGLDADTDSVKTNAFKGVLFLYDMTPINTLSTGSFKEGFLYTDSDKVHSGTIITFARDDGRVRRFKVMEQQAEGQTTVISKRWRVTSIGE